MSLTPGDDRSVADYRQLLDDVLTEVRAARIRAGQAVNAERTLLYWRVGQLILERQQQEGWGATIIDRLAADLAAQFPGARGWSPRNLWYMRALAEAYPTRVRATAVAGLPWGHLTVLMSQVPDPGARTWYAEQASRYGWSRAVLTHHISTRRYERVGQAPDNFTATVPAGEQDLVREVLADPYDLEFLALDPTHSERQLKDAQGQRRQICR
ncbi:DUF1016 N-terminal domain-containing protein [Cellulomonas cellasea]|uniref:YhcG N-terminal domain-containing protein n=2 Tax=Cellulomonas cellasea TaxID=43670 RepID=A0A0A0BDJ9_9CELL|nr:DUF1016 N-terminal domain-containing protein [Cellulomonas cellasea]KGM03396.1 hypothetical protein Q760_03960 [Cellulomonas cellasea DSM 20118]GEA90231.1 hypothetical protein CCE01nite_41800 [Cellulomonas cellasea]